MLNPHCYSAPIFLALVLPIAFSCDEENLRSGQPTIDAGTVVGDSQVQGDTGHISDGKMSGADSGGSTKTDGSGSIEEDSGGSTKNDSSTPGKGIAAKYPGDNDIDKDPNVIFVENFEQSSVDAVVARYESHSNKAGMELVSAVPAKSSGKTSMRWTAGGSSAATDLYKKFSQGYEELYVRYYVKYVSGVQYHHTGVWFGGYNPPTNWANPQAGKQPNGDDRFSIAIEPRNDSSNRRLDFYNYWMKMRSWGGGNYHGNSMVHQDAFFAKSDSWTCIEIHAKLNPNPSSSAGAELSVWQDDQLIQHFTDKAPVGYWIKDKFCPEGADSSSCTNYPPPSGTTLVPLDLQYRTTTNLELNYFWPQNYITSGEAGDVYYDDMVVAKSYIGCIK